MECLLFAGPYDGVYRPAQASLRIPHEERLLHRITVFNPDVRYPKPAIPYKVLPDELLQYFHDVFEKDKRGEFPVQLFDLLRWTTCFKCGLVHARGVCPDCAVGTPLVTKEVIQVLGKVTAKRVFQTTGLILQAVNQFGLRVLYYENGQFKREGDRIVIPGQLDPLMRFRIQGGTTVIAKGGTALVFDDGGSSQRLAIDTFGNLPSVGANADNQFWAVNGQLRRSGPFETSEYIGDVLAGQTLFWVGPAFGCGFYRAGELSVGFVFDAHQAGLNDSVALPPISGQLVDTTATFSSAHCWFFSSVREGGVAKNRCYLISRDAAVLAFAEALVGDGSWLGTIRGKLALTLADPATKKPLPALLAATDDGIVRVEFDGGSLRETHRFTDTEPFVDSHTFLLSAPRGLYAVKSKEVWYLSLA